LCFNVLDLFKKKQDVYSFND